MGILLTPPVFYDTEGNKAKIRGMLAGLNQGNIHAYDDFMASDVILHQESSPAPVKGTKWLKMEDGMLHAAFHDLSITAQSMTATGDRVATRLLYSGTHSGEYMGIPGSGQQYAWSGMVIDRFEDGVIVERWVNVDRFTLLQQVGMIPRFG